FRWAKLAAGNQLDEVGEAVEICDDESLYGVVAEAAPIYAAGGAGELKGAAKAGRGEPSFVAEVFKFGQYFAVEFSHAVPDVEGVGKVIEQGLVVCGEGLGRRCRFARHVALGYGAVFHGKDGLAGLTMQDEDVAHL